jgi:hypothetical protein
MLDKYLFGVHARLPVTYLAGNWGTYSRSAGWVLISSQQVTDEGPGNLGRLLF